MNLNDYAAIWRKQELPSGIKTASKALPDTFERKRRKLATRLFFRDWIEVTAGVLAVGVYAKMWWYIGRDGWPLALAIALILGVTGFFVRERIRTHRHRLGPEASLLAKLEADITELRHQRRLLLGVWQWYLAPIAAAVVIFIFTLLRIALLRIPPETLTKLLHQPFIWGVFMLVFLGCGLLFWGMGVLNQRMARKQLEPRIAELEKFRADIASSTPLAP